VELAFSLPIRVDFWMFGVTCGILVMAILGDLKTKSYAKTSARSSQRELGVRGDRRSTGLRPLSAVSA
jgi:hypothetical protein